MSFADNQTYTDEQLAKMLFEAAFGPDSSLHKPEYRMPVDWPERIKAIRENTAPPSARTIAAPAAWDIALIIKGEVPTKNGMPVPNDEQLQCAWALEHMIRSLIRTYL